MDELSLSEQYRSTQALSNIQRLFWLDDHWTRYLATTTKVSSDDIWALQSITEELGTLLVNVSKDAAWVQHLIMQQPQEFERLWANAVDKSPLTDQEKIKLKEAVQKSGGFAAFIQVNTRGVMDNTAAASAEI